MTINKMRAVHPGEVLAGELKELELSASAFAKALSIPTNRVTTILNGQRSITADTALRLARYFRTSAEFWMNLQTSYDLKIIEKRFGGKIKREVEIREAA